ncbi:hypothetical protein SAMN04487936_101549 [Halobacillus dabanensis]|uniref:Uncharacterized protein n=1 Tax=Halobacillus dabanensis TaxID=240302 RepID=A0A1I3Q661_HALDA|nr:hypothetical protein [Halobacillus dabanensis]SFJ29072.1 hypothetical protein SAMN04487936_101549 [Halobacillus dabanensis]
MNGFVRLIRQLISRKKKLVYTTFMQKEYFKVASRLTNRAVNYRVATIRKKPSRFSEVTTYDHGDEYRFYVKKEDYHRAVSAIHE